MWNSRREKKGQIPGYFSILPAVIYTLAFVGYPIIYNWIISFQNVTAKTIASVVGKFVGFSSYRAISADVTLKRALVHTFIYTIGCLSIQLTLDFLFAMFFTKKFTLPRLIRGFTVIGWMLPVMVAALVLKFMFTEGNDIINYVLISLHLIDKPVGWLLQGNTAMIGLTIANSWMGIPFSMLLLIARLNNILGDIYGAATIDGATGIQEFLRVTIPLPKSTIMSVLILGFMLIFKVFDLAHVMTGGSPVDATEVLSTYSYRLSFQLFHFGEGAAVANVLFVCLLMVALIYLRTILRDGAIQQVV